MIPKPYAIRRVRQLSLGDRKYFSFASRETCFVRDELWIQWLVDHGCKGMIDIPNGRIYDYYLEERSSLRTLTRFEKQLRRTWTAHVHAYPQRKQAILNAVRALTQAVVSGDQRRILGAHREVIRTAYAFNDYIWGAWAIIFVTEPRVMRELPDDVALMMSLEQPIEFIRMKHDLYRKSDQALAAQYGWLNVYSPYDTPYAPEYFRTLRKEIKYNDVKKEFQVYQKTKTRFRAALRRIQSPLLRRSAEMVHTYAFLKTDRVDAWRQVMAELRGFYVYLTRFAPGYTIRDTCNLATREIIQLLHLKSVPPLREIRRRSANHALYFFHNQKIDIVDDYRSIKKMQKKLEGVTKNKGEFKGIVACQGKARGRVKVVTHSSDLSKVKQGDVFVAKYTFPTYTPAMIRSAAFVTDEGGLTGHAAILSREYGIPCIIATKIATRVLKDGDMVEVDAEKGIVRKL